MLQGQGAPPYRPRVDGRSSDGETKSPIVQSYRPMKELSFVGKHFAAIFLDDCARMKWIRLLQRKIDTPDAFKSSTADVATPAGVKIRATRTDGGGEFNGIIFKQMNEPVITPEHTPPGTCQYGGVAERASGLFTRKAVAMLSSMPQGGRQKLWAKAMSIGCDTGNACATTANGHCTAAYEK